MYWEEELSEQIGQQVTYWCPPCFTSLSFLDESLIRLLVEDTFFKSLGKTVVSLANCVILLCGLVTYRFRQWQRLQIALSESAQSILSESTCITYVSFVQ